MATVVRRGSCRRYKRLMDFDSALEWAKFIGGGILGAIGVMVVGGLKFMTDNRRIRTDDRTDLTQQLLSRVQGLEQALVEERGRCDAQMAELRFFYTARIDSLEARVDQLREGGNHAGISDD